MPDLRGRAIPRAPCRSSKVVLSGLPSVVVEERGTRLRAALDRALDRAERAVRRSLGRGSTGRRSGKRADYAVADTQDVKRRLEMLAAIAASVETKHGARS